MPRKERNDATTRGLWAPVIDNGRSRWIVWTDVRTTKRDARNAYLSAFSPEHRGRALGNVTFVRVFLAEEAQK